MIAVLVMIVASLGSALYFIMQGRDDKDPKMMAKALAVRVGLSVLLFVMLIVGWALGLWQPGRL